jgi:preprotein translocase subunit YajC
MGNMMILAATKASTSSSSRSLLPIIIIVVIFMLIYMTMTRRSRARQAAQQQTNLVPGVQVRTTSGMYGTVTSIVDNDDVMVEIAPGVNIRMMRRAVVPLPQDASMGTPAGPPSETPADDDGSDEHEDTPADEWDSQDRHV